MAGRTATNTGKRRVLDVVSVRDAGDGSNLHRGEELLVDVSIVWNDAILVRERLKRMGRRCEKQYARPAIVSSEEHCRTHVLEGPRRTCCQMAEESDPTDGVVAAGDAVCFDGDPPPLNAKPPSFSPAKLVGSVRSGERREVGVSLLSVLRSGNLRYRRAHSTGTAV